jgi:hypothetical protein
LLWQIPYAFHKDYDLMLTGWARKAAAILDEERAEPQAAYRYLGVWNVGTLLLRRTAADQPPAAADPSAVVLRKVANSYVLPRFRFVPRVTFHATHPEALAAARAGHWNVARDEQCVGPARGLVYPRRAELLEVEDQGGRLLLHYRAGQGAFLVAATTFDPGWSARVDGSPVTVSPTAACQLGVELPAGEHRLDLRYRDPRVPAGAALSLAALAAGAVALLRRTKRAGHDGGDGVESPHRVP